MQTVLPILIPSTQNILLMRNEVGRSRSPIRNMPEEGHTYGKAVDRQNIGMKEITSDWQYGSVPQTRKEKSIKLPSVNIVFGLKNKPSTPMNRIINQSYAEEARVELAEVYRRRVNTEHKRMEVHQNRAFSLRLEQHTKKNSKDKELFKLKRYKDVPSKIRSQIL